MRNFLTIVRIFIIQSENDNLHGRPMPEKLVRTMSAAASLLSVLCSSSNLVLAYISIGLGGMFSSTQVVKPSHK
jgi:hypothetical protein